MVMMLSLSLLDVRVISSSNEREKMDRERILNEYVHAADRMSELFGVGLKGPVSIEIFNKERIHEVNKSVAYV
jgi:hypothetical protein